MTEQTVTTQPTRREALRIRLVGIAKGRLLEVSVGLAVLLTRSSTLRQPLLERHDFRQTQTAYQTLTLARGQGSLWNPELPIFGSPWRVPFEFPFFQWTASWVYRLFDVSIDVANRLTSLIFFLLCLWPLASIARRLMGHAGVLLAVVLFSFSPLAIQWSRASLIEYCAVFFGLVFTERVLSTWQTPRWTHLLLGSLAGAVCGGVKATTFLGFLLLAFFLVPAKVETIRNYRLHVRRLAMSSAMAGIPVLFTRVWTTHANSTKASNPATQWLTEENLKTWNYGTLSQRFNWGNWLAILDRVDQLVVIRYSLLFIIIVALSRRIYRRAAAALAAAALVPVVVFFNLYAVHDYYLVAISPMFALISGLAVDGLWTEQRQAPRSRTAYITVVFLLVGCSVMAGRSYWNSAYSKISQIPSDLAAVSNQGQYAFASFGGWNSALLYYADRRGMMLDARGASVEFIRSMPDLAKYDFYAGDLDRVDVLQLRGWYSPAGSTTMRVDDNPLDLAYLGIAFSSQQPGQTQTPASNKWTLRCDGAEQIDLTELPNGSSIQTTSVGSNKFVLAVGLQQVPVGNQLRILDSTKLASKSLVCIGDGSVELSR